MKNAGVSALGLITSRVQDRGQGVGKGGKRAKKFPKYSKAYALTRSRAGLQNTMVDLTTDGKIDAMRKNSGEAGTAKMMQNLKVKRASSKFVIIGFSSPEAQHKANMTTATKGEWLALTVKERREIAKDFRKTLVEASASIRFNNKL